MPTSIYDQIVTRLRKVPVAELPNVLAAIDAATAKKGARGGGKRARAEALDQLAKQAVAIQGSGSKLDEVERAIVAHAFAAAGGNVSAAARLLGIDRKAMERRIDAYGLRR